MAGLLDLDRNIIWHPYTSLLAEDPIIIEKGQGVYIYTPEGREIIDAVSSWWVNIHGHGNAYIAKAIYSQALNLEHVIFAGFTHKPAINLGKRLLEILPKGQEKIFYSDNGSTAVEVGIKMSLQYWTNIGKPRKKLIALKGAYHGDTFGAMSVAERGPFSAAFNELLFDVDFISFPDEGNIKEAEKQFLELVSQNDVAAFIYEPLIQGAAGMRIYSTESLERLLQIAKDHAVLCIADEVMTGFGRTGKLFASSYLTINPDIICLSKGITGGFMAMGVTTCTKKVSDAFESEDIYKTFYHGHSYTANPIACAAAEASLDLLLGKECEENIERISRSHGQFLQNLNSSKVRSAKSLGTILSIELEDVQQSSYFSSLRKHIYTYFLSKDILLRPLGNVIYVLPPYIISDRDLSRVYNEIRTFIDQLH